MHIILLCLIVLIIIMWLLSDGMPYVSHFKISATKSKHWLFFRTFFWNNGNLEKLYNLDTAIIEAIIIIIIETSYLIILILLLLLSYYY